MKKIKAIPLAAIVLVGFISIVMAVNLSPWIALETDESQSPTYHPDIEISGDGAFDIEDYDTTIAGPLVYYEEYYIVAHITSSSNVQSCYDVDLLVALTAPIQSPGVSTDQLAVSWGLGNYGDQAFQWTALDADDWTAIGSEQNPAGLGAGQMTSLYCGQHTYDADFEVSFKFSVGPNTVAQGPMRFSCRVTGTVVV